MILNKVNNESEGEKSKKKRDYYFNLDCTLKDHTVYKPWVGESLLGSKYFKYIYCEESVKVPSTWGKRAHHLCEKNLIASENRKKEVKTSPNSNEPNKLNPNMQVRKFEVKFVDFVAQNNNISFLIREKFVELKDYCDLCIIDNFKLCNTKISDHVGNDT